PRLHSVSSSSPSNLRISALAEPVDRTAPICGRLSVGARSLALSPHRWHLAVHAPFPNLPPGYFLSPGTCANVLPRLQVPDTPPSRESTAVVASVSSPTVASAPTMEHPSPFHPEEDPADASSSHWGNSSVSSQTHYPLPREDGSRAALFQQHYPLAATRDAVPFAPTGLSPAHHPTNASPSLHRIHPTAPPMDRHPLFGPEYSHGAYTPDATVSSNSVLAGPAPVNTFVTPDSSLDTLASPSFLLRGQVDRLGYSRDRSRMSAQYQPALDLGSIQYPDHAHPAQALVQPPPGGPLELSQAQLLNWNSSLWPYSPPSYLQPALAGSVRGSYESESLDPSSTLGSGSVWVAGPAYASKPGSDHDPGLDKPSTASFRSQDHPHPALDRNFASSPGYGYPETMSIGQNYRSLSLGPGSEALVSRESGSVPSNSPVPPLQQYSLLLPPLQSSSVLLPQPQPQPQPQLQPQLPFQLQPQPQSRSQPQPQPQPQLEPHPQSQTQSQYHYPALPRPHQHQHQHQHQHLHTLQPQPQLLPPVPLGLASPGLRWQESVRPDTPSYWDHRRDHLAEQTPPQGSHGPSHHMPLPVDNKAVELVLPSGSDTRPLHGTPWPPPLLPSTRHGSPGPTAAQAHLVHQQLPPAPAQSLDALTGSPVAPWPWYSVAERSSLGQPVADHPSPVGYEDQGLSPDALSPGPGALVASEPDTAATHPVESLVCLSCQDTKACITFLGGSRKTINVPRPFIVQFVCQACEEQRIARLEAAMARGPPDPTLVLSLGVPIPGSVAAAATAAAAAVAMAAESNIPTETPRREHIKLESPAETHSARAGAGLPPGFELLKCNVCKQPIGFAKAALNMRIHSHSNGFGIEVVCSHCDAKYQFCTNCGGGGYWRTGKWRPKELFASHRRTCCLSHDRVGPVQWIEYTTCSLPLVASVAARRDEPINATQWLNWDLAKLSHPELNLLLKKLKDIWLELMMAKVAQPKVMEHFDEYSTFRKISQQLERIWSNEIVLLLTTHQINRKSFLTLGLISKYKNRKQRYRAEKALRESDGGPSSKRGHPLPAKPPEKTIGAFCTGTWRQLEGTFQLTHRIDRRHDDPGGIMIPLIYRMIKQFLQDEAQAREVGFAFPACRYVWFASRKSEAEMLPGGSTTGSAADTGDAAHTLDAGRSDSGGDARATGSKTYVDPYRIQLCRQGFMQLQEYRKQHPEVDQYWFCDDHGADSRLEVQQYDIFVIEISKYFEYLRRNIAKS
ncbi:uncharacterized protein BJ171DRAFT_216083, partial [Polychytrium aggregatum]|uniref:uncharacterized protein n=1 Tax=Polychytrium aggregatum TaxID=110093 RepID=UPI0022FEFD42